MLSDLSHDKTNTSYLVFSQGVIVECAGDVHQCLGLRPEGLHDFWMAMPLVHTFIERLSVSVTSLIIHKVSLVTLLLEYPLRKS